MQSDFREIKKLLGNNFIGSDELTKISSSLNISNPSEISVIPPVPYTLATLTKLRHNYILILGIPVDKAGRKLTINNMRLWFGTDPSKREPCFYNQDWYLKEPFADKSLGLRWYLISKNINQDTRGLNPECLNKKYYPQFAFPSAVLTTFTFFAYYFLNKKKLLWANDFIWSSDKDTNGDRIFVGRYKDPKGINRNGFNIHRYLKIRDNFGLAPQYK